MKATDTTGTPRLHFAQTGSISSLSDLLGSVKETVNFRLVREFRTQLPAAIVRRAVDEAEHVARSTDFPWLFLPELASEEVRRAQAAIVRHDPDAQFSSAA